MGRIVKKSGYARLPVKQQRTCTICMELLPANRECGQLSCGHNSFCFSCISNWAQVTNACPLCKKRFGIIIKCHSTQTDIVPGAECVLVEDKDMHLTQANPTLADFIREIRCVVCGSDMDEDIMLLCDDCDKGFHTTCIGLDHIPNLELWYCEQCLESQTPETIAHQHEEMKLAAKHDSHTSTKKHKRIKKATDLAESPKRSADQFQGLQDFPAGFFEACDPLFEEVASQLTADDL